MDNAEQLKRDEERIKHDEERLKRDAERLAHDEERLIQDKKVKYFFSLDGKKYESDTSSINGADVSANGAGRTYPTHARRHRRAKQPHCADGRRPNAFAGRLRCAVRR